MKLVNTTEWPDYFLRRMTAWCCRQMELSPKKIRRIKFRNRMDGFATGHCYYGSGRICVSCGRPGETGRDYFIDSLVSVTAHEVAHLAQYRRELNGAPRSRRNGHSEGGSEPNTRGHEAWVMNRFREKRSELLAEWSKPHARKTTEPVPAADRRAAKALTDLERWQRKAKLAQTKIRKLKARVRYYERRAAAKSANSN